MNTPKLHDTRCQRFIDAIVLGDAVAVKGMIDDGIDTNMTLADFSSTFPILVAASKGHAHIVALLLAAGCNVNRGDSRGNTALHAAVAGNHRNVVELLIDAGANVNCRGEHDRTPLHVACVEPHAKMVELLIAANANVNACDNNGNSVCHYVAFDGAIGLIEVLAPAGADVNAVNNGGSTPCHMAMQQDHFDAVERLIVVGANVPTAGDGFGWTVAHHAVFHNSEQGIKLAIAAGVDLGLRNSTGSTPLDMAVKYQALFSVFAAIGQSTPDGIALRHKVAHIQLNFIRKRASEVCMATQSAGWPALITLTIIDEVCPAAYLVPMHLKWKLVTAVKHFEGSHR